MPCQLIRPLAPIGLLVLGLLLSGCALLRPDHAAPLPGGGHWQPLEPQQLGRSFSAVQKVTGEFGETRAVLVFYLEVDKNLLALVATTPDGTELFKLSLSGQEIRVTASPLLPKQLRPEAVLADLQMAYWPAAAVRQALVDSGLDCIESSGVRTIRRGDDDVIVIRYDGADPWRGNVEFEQRAWRYRYRVETVQLEE